MKRLPGFRESIAIIEALAERAAAIAMEAYRDGRVTAELASLTGRIASLAAHLERLVRDGRAAENKSPEKST